LKALPPQLLEEIAISDEAANLAREYITANVLDPASESDALHVAVADLILS